LPFGRDLSSHGVLARSREAPSADALAGPRPALPAVFLSVVRDAPPVEDRLPPRNSPADEGLLVLLNWPPAGVLLLPPRTSSSEGVLAVFRLGRAQLVAEPVRPVLEFAGRGGLRAPSPSRGAGPRRDWSPEDVLRALPDPRDPSAAGARLNRRGPSADVTLGALGADPDEVPGAPS
jgi:hypothetical protein